MCLQANHKSRQNRQIVEVSQNSEADFELKIQCLP